MKFLTLASATAALCASAATADLLFSDLSGVGSDVVTSVRAGAAVIVANTVVESIGGGVVAADEGDHGAGGEIREGEVGSEGDLDLSKEHLFDHTPVRHSVIRAVNARRNATGLPPLCSHFKLINTAQSQASYIAETNTFSVVGEDGFTPSDRGRWALLHSPGIAEVIGAGFAQAADVVAAWLNSTEAQAIVLGNYTHIGPGYAVNETQAYTHYWAVDFAYAPDQNCSGLPEDTTVAV